MNYTPVYRKYIDERNETTANKMVRGKFYFIKEYEYVDGDAKKHADSIAPIIFTLFVSKAKDIVHSVKISNINPNLVKRFFGKLINEKTEKLELKGSSKIIYEHTVSKLPFITEDSYRTYKLSGIKKIVELKMDVNELTPKSKNVTGIDSKSQVKNR